MSRAFDRRQFLRAGGRAAVGLSILKSALVRGAPPPPPIASGTGLKVSVGDGLVQLPPGAARRLGSPRMRVGGHVNALQFSPRGNAIIAASSELRSWDPRTARVLFRLGYPQSASVSAGRLTSRDSFALLVQPDSGGKFEIRHYAFTTGKSVSESPPLDFGQAQHTAFSVDGSLMAVVHQEALHLYDSKGVEKWHEPLPPQAIGGCRFFADGSTLAVATKGEIKLFAAATGKITSTLKVGAIDADPAGQRGKDWIGEPIASDDGKWLAAPVGEDSDWVLCWDVNAGTVRHRVKAAKPIGFTPDGSELVTYKDMVATAWTLASGAAARTLDVPVDNDLVLSPDGKILAASDGDSVILIDAVTGKHLAHSSDPPGLPAALRFDGTKRLVGLLTGWGGWVVWDLTADSAIRLRPPGMAGYTPIDLSADGTVALYRRQAEYTARDVATGKTLFLNTGVEAVNDATTTATLAPDGRSLIAPADDGVAVVTAAGRKVIKRPGPAAEPIVAIAVTADSRLAAAAYGRGEEHGRVEVYDLAAGAYLRAISVDGDVSHLAFVPDGSWLAVGHNTDQHRRSGTDQRTVTVYDPLSGRAILQQVAQQGYGDPVFALSAGGRMLARLEVVDKQPESEYKIAIWEVQGNLVRTRFDAGGSVAALAFALDSRTLAASVSGAPIFLWELYAAAKDVPPPTPADLGRAWDDLRSANGAAAFTAIKLFAGCPDLAVPFLRGKVAPVAPPDPEQVKAFIDGLDHKDYRRREAATRGLADLGERGRHALQQALAAKPTPEARERIERLLAAGDRPTPDSLRRLRAVEAMEVAGTAAAGELLAHWAAGAPGAHFTRDADASAKRLAAR